MRAHRVTGLVLAWVIVLGAARVVALPERCPSITAPEARAAATEAVGWFQRNQGDDGRWVYRYQPNADTGAIDRRSHVVRHSGVAMSLYQAHAAGIPGALATADAGVDWSLDQLVRHGSWAAVRSGPEAPTGATALLLAGLSIRRAATGDGRYDQDMADFGRYLVAMTEPSGAVGAAWDVDAERPVPGAYSKFFTGEAYYALALLAEVDPAGEWAAVAERIGRYLATQRDDAEDRFPPTSDHWAALGLAQMASGVGRPLDADGTAYAGRLAAILGVQVRYESQRTGAGLNRWVLRGPQALGAAVGTLGEGLGALWRLSAEGDDTLDRGDIAERLRCVAGMLADRQVTADEAAGDAHPGLMRGAWFRLGVTQMDDQQHALSALLAAAAVLPGAASAPTDAHAGGGGDDDWSLARSAWVALVGLAAVNPARVRRLVGPIRSGEGPGLTARAVALGVAVALGMFVILAAVGGPLLDALDVSPATGLVAAGLMVAVTALADALLRPPERWGDPGPADGALVPVALPALVRPAVALLVLAVAADAGVGPGAGVAVAAAVGAGAATWSGRPAGPGGGTSPRLAGTVRWGFAALAVLGGIDLVVHGVLAV